MAHPRRSPLSKIRSWSTDPAAGWDARLWRRWAIFGALAYTVILTVILVITTLGLDVTRVAIDHRAVGTLLIATAGAGLYGTVLGFLQWRVLRERLPMPLRRWVLASFVPALAIWALVVVPAAVSAEARGDDLRVAYFLALSQALALGPLIGFAQAKALRPYTDRWKWWIPANLVSWLIVYAASYVVALVFDRFDFTAGEGSPLEAYLLLIAATPLSGRWMLWITAPGRRAQPSSR